MEPYQLEGLIRETVEDDILEEDINPLTNFVSDLLGSNPRAYKRLANLGCDPSVKISEKDFNRLMDMAQASGTLEKLNEIYDRELEHMQGS